MNNYLTEDAINILKEEIENRKIIIRKQINEDLKVVFDTNNDVLILTSSGTGSMESTIVNLFSTNDEVLVINTGWFGERFIEICQVYGLQVHELRYEWG